MMKKFFLTSLFLYGYQLAFSCTTCNKVLQQSIFDSTFYPNLIIMLLAFLVLALIVIGLLIAGKRQELKAARGGKPAIITPMVTATTTLGIGMGGMLDGTVLHQILQWHEMLSNKIQPVTLLNKSINMFWDGIFHLFCFLIIFTGLLMLCKVAFCKKEAKSWGKVCGGLILGWGIFNVVEGLIDHQFLKLHNVKETSAVPELWNYSFLLISVLLIIVGWLIIRRADKGNLLQRNVM